MPVIPALRRLEDLEFQASLGYIARPCLKNKTKPKIWGSGRHHGISEQWNALLWVGPLNAASVEKGVVGMGAPPIFGAFKLELAGARNQVNRGEPWSKWLLCKTPQEGPSPGIDSEPSMGKPPVPRLWMWTP
jgi:hypothetical protein